MDKANKQLLEAGGLAFVFFGCIVVIGGHGVGMLWLGSVEVLPDAIGKVLLGQWGRLSFVEISWLTIPSYYLVAISCSSLASKPTVGSHFFAVSGISSLSCLAYFYVFTVSEGNMVSVITTIPFLVCELFWVGKYCRKTNFLLQSLECVQR